VPAGLFLLVPMGFLTIMAFIPLIKEVWLSFTNARLTNPNGGAYVGLGNYRTLFSGPELPQVLRNTLVYTIGTSALSLAGGILAAVVVNTRFRGHSVVRGILAAPWAVPGVAAALIFLWMFNTTASSTGSSATSVSPPSRGSRPQAGRWSRSSSSPLGSSPRS
jgi:multiple sugar transport system permease protein